MLISLSCGIAYAVLPWIPSIVSAAIIAFTIDSSTACAVASNRGVIRSLDSALTLVVFFRLKAFLFAVEKAKNILPDFILLDIIMPKMDGFAVLKALKEDVKTKNIPVMLLTNLGQEEDIKRGEELGVVGYLVKANTTPSEVVEAVKNKLNN